jgi:predicted nucleic acid-binding protein
LILVDTSVWVDHLRKGDAGLIELLDTGQVITHPLIIGEIAMGSLRTRTVVLDSLQRLPRAMLASDEEVLEFVERHKLHGRGVGYVDAHLLASTQISQIAVWTRDKRLAAVAKTFGRLHQK